jgi:hypothetical protein
MTTNACHISLAHVKGFCHTSLKQCLNVEWSALLLRTQDVPIRDTDTGLLTETVRGYPDHPGKCWYNSLNQATTASFYIPSHSLSTTRTAIRRYITVKLKERR